MNNDRLLSPPVTPKPYSLDTLSKHQQKHELVEPTEIYIPPVSPPTLMDCVSSSSTVSTTASTSSYSSRHPRQNKTFKFHLEREKALPSLSSSQNTLYVKKASEKEIIIPNSLPPLRSHRRQRNDQKKVILQKTVTSPMTTKEILSSPATSAATLTIPTSRIKEMPHRSLSPDAAEHVFSLYFNAEQVRQYSMQAMSQKNGQRQQQLQLPQDRGKHAYCLDLSNKNNDTYCLTAGYPNSNNSNNNEETKALLKDDQLSRMTSKRPFASTLASTADRHMKKSRTEAAAAYDRVDVTVDDILVYDPEWVPLYDVFDRKPNVRPTYKGKANSPLQIDHMEFYDRLHPCEVNIASQLRLQPKQYLMCKRSLILGAQDSYKSNMPFRKSDAQKLCRIDVNKVSHLWALFARLGWLEPHTPVYHQ
ncbi:hypothetical protein INT45_007523 [Circinella minor]|uniref:SWIRM domain-containing protein n=1 Tax=Circinella minor TaxID=1195481 RepID=A0A8H7VQE1_9FUNG|nr:hypothetical protein INT45_007523 [Circinella minor]